MTDTAVTLVTEYAALLALREHLEFYRPVGQDDTDRNILRHYRVSRRIEEIEKYLWNLPATNPHSKRATEAAVFEIVRRRPELV